MREDNLFEKIESWLDGSMPKQAADDFSKRLKTDTELYQLVEKHKKAQKVVEDWATEEHINMIRDWKKNNYSNPEPEKKNFKASHLLLLLTIGIAIIGAIYFSNREEIIEMPPPSTEEEDKSVKKPAFAIDSSNSQNQKNKKEEIVEQKKQSPSLEKEKLNSNNKVIDKKIEPSPPSITLIASIDEYIDTFENKFSKGLNVKGLDSKSNYKAGSRAFQEKNYSEAFKHLILIGKEAGMDYTKTLAMLAIINYHEKNYTKAADYFLQYSEKNINEQTVEWTLLQFLYADYKNRKDEFWELLNGTILSDDFKHDYRKKGETLKKELEEKGIKE